MAATERPQLPEPFRGRTRDGAAVAAGAVAAAALGAAAVAFATRVSITHAQWILVGLVAVPTFAVLAFRRPYVAVLAVFAAFPFASVTILPSLQLVESVALAGAVIVGLSRLSRGETLLSWAPEFWWLVAILVWTLVSFRSASDNLLAAKQVAQLVAVTIFGCLVLSACRRRSETRILIGGLIAVAVIVVLVGLSSGQASRVSTSLGGENIQGRLHGSFTQPNQLGSFCALTLLVALGAVFAARSHRWRAVAAIASAVILVGLLLSYSRGAWIGLAVGALVFCIAVRPARRTLLVLAVPVIIVGVLSGSFAASRPEVKVIELRAKSIRERSPYDNRTSVWTEALREVRTSPVTGVGPGNFPVASTRAASATSTIAADHAHDIWLNWAAETGIPGALLVTGFMVTLIAVARRSRLIARAVHDDAAYALIAGLGAGLLSVLVQGFIDYTIRNTPNLFAVFAAIGLLLALAREMRARAATA